MERHQGDLVPLGKDGFFKDPFFSSTWEEFDQERHQMMQKSPGFWDKVDQDMKEFESSVSKMDSDMDRMTAPLRPTLPGWALPEDHKKNWPIILGEDAAKVDTFKITETGDKWEILLDVSKFNQDGLKVKVAGDMVTITGSHSNQFAEGNNSSNTDMSFTKRYTLPSGCDSDQVHSNLNAHGTLVVSCPRKQYLYGPSEKAIKFRK
eukprot:GFUD01027060.1.p1 GENE.GFUD01027060.1~~GFUD01027060.1.p1  ORF type:complete len:206 (+),score=60.69 GFUD01027060.1:51-668(+)